MPSSKIGIQINQKVSQALVGSQGCECSQVGMELKELTEFLTSSDLWMSHQFLDVGVELKSSRLVELSIDLASCPRRAGDHQPRLCWQQHELAFACRKIPPTQHLTVR